jgi:hypothetical protein
MLLDGYDFVGEGGCRDAQGNGYMQIMYVYTANRELCAEYCDRYRDIDEAEGKLRGFWWNDATNIGQPSDKHCYCQFEGGSDIEQLAKQFGVDEQIRLENFGSTATGTICSAAKASYDAWCYRISEDTVDSASSCRSSAGEPTMKMTASPTISVSVIKPVTKAPTAAAAGGGVFSKAGKSKTQTKTSKAGSSSSKSGKATKSAKIAGKQGKSNHNTVQSNIQQMKYDVLNGAGAVGMYAVNFVSVAAAVLAAWSCSM